MILLRLFFKFTIISNTMQPTLFKNSFYFLIFPYNCKKIVDVNFIFFCINCIAFYLLFRLCFCSELRWEYDDKTARDVIGLPFHSRARSRLLHPRLLRLQWFVQTLLSPIDWLEISHSKIIARHLVYTRNGRSLENCCNRWGRRVEGSNDGGGHGFGRAS